MKLKTRPVEFHLGGTKKQKKSVFLVSIKSQFKRPTMGKFLNTSSPRVDSWFIMKDAHLLRYRVSGNSDPMKSVEYYSGSGNNYGTPRKLIRYFQLF